MGYEAVAAPAFVGVSQSQLTQMRTAASVANYDRTIFQFPPGTLTGDVAGDRLACVVLARRRGGLLLALPAGQVDDELLVGAGASAGAQALLGPAHVDEAYAHVNERPGEAAIRTPWRVPTVDFRLRISLLIYVISFPKKD